MSTFSTIQPQLIIIAVGIIWLIVPAETSTIISLYDDKAVVPINPDLPLTFADVNSELAPGWEKRAIGMDPSLVTFHHAKKNVCMVNAKGNLIAEFGSCNVDDRSLFQYTEKKCIVSRLLLVDGVQSCLKNEGESVALRTCPNECFGLALFPQDYSRFMFDIQ
jgi:hypothetical protein